MRPGIKIGQCCRDAISEHPIIVVSIRPVDEEYYCRLNEFIRRILNQYKVFKVYGISLVDGSLKSFKVSRSSPAKTLRVSTAYLERKEIRKENNVR